MTGELLIMAWTEHGESQGGNFHDLRTVTREREGGRHSATCARVDAGQGRLRAIEDGDCLVAMCIRARFSYWVWSQSPLREEIDR